MKYIGRFAFLFLLAVKAYATVTVTIDVSGITGGNLPGSSIVISLQHCATARVVGTGQIVPQTQTVYPHFGASTITLFDNTQINCSGQIVSYYSFSFIYQGVTTQIGSYNLPPGIYQLANLAPCTGTACYGPTPPATPVTQIIAGANITLSPPTGVGAVTVSSSAGGLNQLTGDVTAGPGTGSQATTLATVNTGPGACGDATHVCQVTTNGKGLTTGQMAVAIAAGGSSGATGTVQVAGSTAGSFAASLMNFSAGNFSTSSGAGLTTDGSVGSNANVFAIGGKFFLAPNSDGGQYSMLVFNGASSATTDQTAQSIIAGGNTIPDKNMYFNVANTGLFNFRIPVGGSYTVPLAIAATGITAAGVIDSALTPSTSPICPNGSGGALTTSGCVGSGITGQTNKFVPLAGSSTTLTATSHIDDGATTAGVVTITEPVSINPGAGPHSLQIGPNVFSALPACAGGTEGTQATVTDSTTNAWGATVTGGGTNHVLAYCDGTNWTIEAK